ncbi:acyl carrier protein [Acinetobacter sp. 187]|uniref:phosphopantetheine-binding protein n=1 Tax=Acinetobacter lanii TaxID=2715163 RepID=UPI00140D55DE|nr:phosphopantetheine-binding protein [Acinetobacter lanii]NHC04110.1 acyl carrier protein [Acinetobacter lanii]
MFYAMPHKFEFAPSQAKWRIDSSNSVLIMLGLNTLSERMNVALDAQECDLSTHLSAVLKKAKTLDITVLDVNPNNVMHSMMQLGEAVSEQRQLMFTGWIDPMAKQLIQHIAGITTQICIIDDAILLENKSQHLQWINSLAEQGIHHASSATLNRMWSLSAPSQYILSDKGILLTIAEQLDLEPLEIDPSKDLRSYGLDSIAMVSLIGLWRANGAHISYESFLASCTLEKLMTLLKSPS